MAKRDEESAAKLAAMASTGEIAYVPTGGVHYGPTYGNPTGRKWYEMAATGPEGREWRYFLSHDFGDYRGAWPNEIGA